MQWVEEMPQYGDVIRTKVQFYYHYGIFAGDDCVVQFGLPDNAFQRPEDVKVLCTDVGQFLCGGELQVGRPDQAERRKMRKPEQIVAEAKARLGEGGYDLLHNNCEHFVNQCAFGEHHSSFLESVRQSLRKKLGKE